MQNNRFEELAYLKLMLSIEGIGPQKIFSLLSKYNSIEEAFHATKEHLIDTPGINKILAIKISSAITDLEKVKVELQKTIEKLDRMGGKILSYWDDEYPELLKKIYFPPLIIYCMGNFTSDDEFSVAIVGTRQPSVYGKLEAERFSYDLAAKNITIVSGLARGIDSIAHESALKANGRTIAVIGSGLDVIYPPENKKLFERIKESGVVVSEFELGTKPDAQNFPRRNRIIAGLSLGTLIVETKFTGGAMQTAAYALDQNREVFALPGNVNVIQSEGPNSLIQRSEAKLVTCAEDILAELGQKLKSTLHESISKPVVELTLFEEKVYDVLRTEPIQIDEIASAAAMNTSDCLVNLLTLEFKGVVKQLPGKMFVRC